MINDLMLWVDTLSVVGVVVLLLGMAILFSLGCILVQKSRAFYVLPMVSAFIGYLFLQNVVLHSEFAYEYARQLAGILPMMSSAILMGGAIAFGENNIKMRSKQIIDSKAD